ncbi:DUF4224 domain-containing protein [Paraburkholderia flagellata]|uniref:DUF4224 domain-containing protein n=1 Tax=Paraburkholderia flagellata TaxID=2883241 RepID=UPI001F32B5B4|nr:DUF4224 domain-containing protein [Paraburkholderia flagellata]
MGELTGVLTGRRGKTREQLRVEWLRTSGIPFWTNARGRPIISRSAIEGRPSCSSARVRPARNCAWKLSESSSLSPTGFARARAGIASADFQFRDLRAKAGTDSTGDIRQAQKQLGHGSISMTEHYVRKRSGEKVGSTR